MTCPVCQLNGDPAASAGGVSVCAGCGASLCADESWARDPRLDALDTQETMYRRATAAETTTLSADDLATLRKARGLARRKS